MKYFAKIKYLGTDFHGFQVQPGGLRTVQGELCKILPMALGCPVTVTGCSRTDAGVHANEFCILINAEGATVPPDKLPVAVARYMPCDLSLYYAEKAGDDFHPRYNAIGKEYLYVIRNSRVYDPFDFNRCHFIPHIISDIGLSRMKACAVHFIGKHDFRAFMAEGGDAQDTERTVKYLNIERDGEKIEIHICADGFLYNMVRIIVGTLCEVAFGRIEPDDIPRILESKNRINAGPTAPAQGLYLNKVIY